MSKLYKLVRAFEFIIFKLEEKKSKWQACSLKPLRLLLTPQLREDSSKTIEDLMDEALEGLDDMWDDLDDWSGDVWDDAWDELDEWDLDWDGATTVTATAVTAMVIFATI